MRALLWAPGGGRQVVEYDKTTLLNNGVAAFGVWVSGPVWDGDKEHSLAELDHVAVAYVAEGVSSFQMAGSGDGGETWISPIEPSPVPVVEHHMGEEIVNVFFNGVQGHHLAIRFCFDRPEIIVALSFLCRCVVRGSVIYRTLRFV